MGDGGKGDGRRKGADDAKYRDNWDRIFGKRDGSSTKGDPDKGPTDGNAAGMSSLTFRPRTANAMYRLAFIS